MSHKSSLLSCSALRPGKLAAIGMIALFAMGNAAAQDVGSVVVNPDADISFQPDVFSTGNGTVVVDITNPTNGVSINQFERFDVDENGVVLNNSTVAGESVLAGQIAGNRNFSGAAADIIVNEVASSDGASLNGALEVFGQRADVIVASPNGISCDGCAFINTNAVTLATGTVNTDNGLVVEVTGGTVAVEEDGLQADGSVRLVGRKVELNGVARASGELVASGGAQNFDARTGTASARDGAPATSEEYAVDGTNFGVAQAGQITVIGNEAGLGVRLLGAVQAGEGGFSAVSAGDLFARSVQTAGDVSLEAVGNIEIDRDVTSRGDTVLTSTGGNVTLNEDGGLFAGGVVGVEAAEDVAIAGEVQSFGRISVVAGGDLRSTGVLTTLGEVEFDAAGNIDVAEGRIAGQSAVITAGEEARIGNGFIDTIETVSVAGRDIALGEVALFRSDRVDLTAAEDFENAANLAGLGETLALTFGSDLRNLATGIFAFEQIDLDIGGAVINEGLIFAETDIRLRAGDLTNSLTGQIFAQNLVLDIDGGVINDGTIAAADTLNLTVANQLLNNGVLSAQTLSLMAGEARNLAAGRIQSEAGTLTVSLLTDLDNAGIIFSDEDLTIALSGVLSTSGVIAANGDGHFDVGGFEGLAGNEVQAVNLILNAAANFSNRGFLASFADIDITAGGSFENFGQLQSGGDIDVLADTVFVADTGVVQAIGGLDFRVADGFVQNGIFFSGARIGLETGGGFDQAGLTVATGALDISALSFASGLSAEFSGEDVVLDIEQSVEHSGVLAGDTVRISAGEIDNSGAIQADTDLQLLIDRLLENRGTGILSSGGAGNLVAQSIVNNGQAASLGDFRLEAVGSLTNNGIVQSAASLTFLAEGLFVGATGLSSGEALTATLGTLDNSGVLNAATRLGIEVTGEAQNSGQLLAQGDVALTTGTFAQSDAGAIGAGERVRLITGGFSNAGLVSAFGSLDIDIGTGTNVGRLEAGARLDLEADRFENLLSGLVTAADLSLSADTLLNSGQMIGANVMLAGTDNLMSDGLVSAISQLDIDGQVLGLGGAVLGGLVSVDGQAVALSGQLEAAQGLAVEASGDLLIDGVVGFSNTASFVGDTITSTATSQIARFDGLQGDLTLSAVEDVALDGILFADSVSVDGRNITTLGTSTLLAVDELVLDAAGGLLIQGSGQADRVNLISEFVTLAEQSVFTGFSALATDAGDTRIDGRLESNLISILSDGLTVSETGTVIGLDDLTVVSGGDVRVAGVLSAGDALSISRADPLASVVNLTVTGQVLSGQELNLTLDGLINDGVLSGTDVDLDLATFTGVAGSLLVAETLDLAASEALASDGAIGASGTLTLSSRDITATSGSEIEAANLVLLGDDRISLGGTVTAGDLDLQTPDLTLTGSIATTDFSFTGLNFTSAAGSRVEANGEIDLDIGTLFQIDGLLASSGGTRLVAGGGLTIGSAGRIESTGLIDIDAADTVTLAGTVLGLGDIGLDASGFVLESGAVLAAINADPALSGGLVTLTLTGDLDVTGQISAGALTVETGGSFLSRAGSLTQASNRLSVSAPTQISIGGALLSEGETVLDTSELTILQGGSLQVPVFELATSSTFTLDGVILADELTLDAAGLTLGDEAALVGTDALTVRLGTGVLVNAGELSGGTLLIEAADFTDDALTGNQSAVVFAQTSLVGNFNAADVSGTIGSNGTSVLNAMDVTVFETGRIVADTLTANVDNGLTNAGLIQAGQFDIFADVFELSDTGLVLARSVQGANPDPADRILSQVSARRIDVGGTIASASDLTLSGTDVAQSVGGVIASGSEAGTGTTLLTGSNSLQLDGVTRGTDIRLNGAGLVVGALVQEAVLDDMGAPVLDMDGNRVFAAIGGLISAGESLTLGTGADPLGAPVIDGVLSALGSIDVFAGLLSQGAGGQISAGTDFTLTGNLAQSGAINAGRTLTLNGALAQSGTGVLSAQTGDLVVMAGATDIQANGALVAGGDVTLRGQSLTQAQGGVIVSNFGDLQEAGALSADRALIDVAGGALGINGTVAGPNVELIADTLTLGARIGGEDGLVSGDRNILISGSVRQFGTITSGGTLTVQNGVFFDQEADGVLFAAQDLSVNVGGQITGDGTIASDANVTLIGGGLAQARAGVIASNLNGPAGVASTDLTRIAVGGGVLTLNGTVSGPRVDIDAGLITLGARTADVGGLISATDRLDITGALTQSGAITSGGTLTVTGPSFLQNGGGLLFSNGDLRVDITGAITANGTIASDRDVSIVGTGLTLGRLATIASGVDGFAGTTDISVGNGALVLNGTVTGDTVVLRGGRLDLGRRLNDVGGLILADNVLNVGLSGVLSNSGVLQSGGTATLSVGGITNTGSLNADTLVIRNATELRNSGTVFTAGNFDVANGRFSLLNSGALTVAGTGTFDIDRITNTGSIEANTFNLTLDRDFQNDGSLIAIGGLSITTPGALINNNRLASNGLLTLNADRLRNSAGAIIQAGSVDINLTQIAQSIVAPTQGGGDPFTSLGMLGLDLDGLLDFFITGFIPGNPDLVPDSAINDGLFRSAPACDELICRAVFQSGQIDVMLEDLLIVETQQVTEFADSIGVVLPSVLIPSVSPQLESFVRTVFVDEVLIPRGGFTGDDPRAFDNTPPVIDIVCAGGFCTITLNGFFVNPGEPAQAIYRNVSLAEISAEADARGIVLPADTPTASTLNDPLSAIASLAGRLGAGQTVTLRTGDFLNAGIVEAAGTVDLFGTRFVNSGDVSGFDAAANLSGVFDSARQSFGGVRSVDVTAQRLVGESIDALVTDQNLSIDLLEGDIVISDDLIVSGDISLTSIADIVFEADIGAFGNLFFNAGDDIVNEGADVLAGRNIVADANNLIVNRGLFQSGNNIALFGSGLQNESGAVIQARNTLTAQITDTTFNEGVLTGTVVGVSSTSIINGLNGFLRRGSAGVPAPTLRPGAAPAGEMADTVADLVAPAGPNLGGTEVPDVVLVDDVILEGPVGVGPILVDPFLPSEPRKLESAGSVEVILGPIDIDQNPLQAIEGGVPNTIQPVLLDSGRTALGLEGRAVAFSDFRTVASPTIDPDLAPADVDPVQVTATNLAGPPMGISIEGGGPMPILLIRPEIDPAQTDGSDAPAAATPVDVPQPILLDRSVDTPMFDADPVADANQAAMLDTLMAGAEEVFDDLQGLRDIDDNGIVTIEGGATFETLRDFLGDPAPAYDTGAIVGENVFLTAAELFNAGTIDATELVRLDADNITNLGGDVLADTIALISAGDVSNRFGDIVGGSVGILAGGNVLNDFSNLISDVDDVFIDASGDFTNRNSGRINAATDLSVFASGDILNEAQTIQFRLTEEHGCRGAACGRFVDDFLASEIAAGGNLLLSAGGELSNIASNIGAVGDVDLRAVGDINNEALTSVFTIVDINRRRGLLGREIIREESAIIRGSSVQAGGNLFVTADGDIQSSGSVFASNGVTDLLADGDIVLNAAVEELEFYERQRGFSGFTYSNVRTERNDFALELSQVLGETVYLSAGRDVTGAAAVVAAADDLSISAGRDIGFGAEQLEHFFEERGFSIGVSFTGSDLIETVINGGSFNDITGSVLSQNPFTNSLQRLAGSDTPFEIGFNALNSATRGLDFSRNVFVPVKDENGDIVGPTSDLGRLVDQFNPFSGISNDPVYETDKDNKIVRDTNGAPIEEVSGTRNLINSLNITLSFGTHRTRQDFTTSEFSSLTAGGDLILDAGRDINLIGGTDIDVAGDAILNAGRDILLEAQADTFRERSSSFGGSLGLGAGGVTVGVNVSGGRTDGTTFTPTTLDVGGHLTLISGRDTTLSGARIEAASAAVLVGRDLTIETLQNLTESRQFGFNASVTLAPAPTGGSFGVNGSRADRQFSDDVSGIVTDGALDVDVGGTTSLIGATLGSRSEDFRLSTEELVTRDLEDSDRSRSFSLGGSAGQNDAGENFRSLTGVNGSFSTATREGTTFATLGQGEITIGGQTGEAIADQLAGLNRDLDTAQVITRDSSFSTGDLELDVGALLRARDNVGTIARNISARQEASQLDLEGEDRSNYLVIRNAGISAEAAQRIEREGFLRAGSDAITALSGIGVSPDEIEELLFEDGLGDQLGRLDHRTNNVVIGMGIPDLGEPELTEPDELLANSNAGVFVLDLAGHAVNYIGELAQENPRKAQLAAFGLEFATNANPLVAGVKIIADEALQKAFGNKTQVFHEGASGFLTALANGHSLDVAIEIATNPQSREAFLANGSEGLKNQFGGGQLVSNSILPGGADLVDLARGFARRGVRGGADAGGGGDVGGGGSSQQNSGDRARPEDSEAGFSGIQHYATSSVDDLPANVGPEYRNIRNGVARPNVRRPKTFDNEHGDLPQVDRNGQPITYTEYTVNPRPPGGKLDRHRVIEGSDGNWYYWNHQRGENAFTIIVD